MFRLSNIRIGIKLMIMSGAGILLVVGMIVGQMMGNSSARHADEGARHQQRVTRGILEAKVESHLMQIAVRDIRLSKDRAGSRSSA